MNLRRFVVAVVAGLTVSAVYAGGRTFVDNEGGKVSPVPEWCSGSMTPVPLCERFDIEVPDSLDAVYMCHVGRHGARFLSTRKKVDVLYPVLEKARQERCLSATGEDLLALLHRVDSVTAGRWGAITQMGRDEGASTGWAVTRTFPDLMRCGRVNAEATFFPRVIMTMYEFCHSLADYSTHLAINTSEGQEYDRLLRCFVADEAYAAYLDSGEWRVPYDEYAARTLPVRPAKALFRKGYRLTDAEARGISKAMYEVFHGMTAADMECDYRRFFTPAEYEGCWRTANLKHFLCRTDNRWDCVADAASLPLLRDIEAKIDSAGGDGDEIMQAYFAHAETLLPLYSAMGIPCCIAPDAETDDVWKVWRDYELVPLGAYLSIPVFRTPSGDKCVALILNGKAVCPLPDDARLIVPWTELKSYWEERTRKATE